MYSQFMMDGQKNIKSLQDCNGTALHFYLRSPQTLLNVQ